MSLIERLIQNFAPHYCLGCDAVGSILCATCVAAIPRMPERCYKCARPTMGALTCGPCSRTSALSRLIAVTPYEGTARELIQTLKFGRARAAARTIAELMAQCWDFDADLLVHAPTVPARVRARGYDQAKLIAEHLSRRVSDRSASVFVRIGRERQLGKSRHDRLQQAGSFFALPRPDRVAGKRIVLIDDVVTTGATLESAALLCRNAGAERVEAMVFAAA